MRIRHEKRVMDALDNYTVANRTDPFARNRALTHLHNGIAGTNKDGEPDYDTHSRA